MSRMFSVLSGGASASARPTGPASPSLALGAAVAGAEPVPAPAESDTAFAVESQDIPFVEIGGPDGAVFSAGPGAKPVPEPPAEEPLPVSRAATEAPPRTYPRLAKPLYLSVTFHDITGAARPQLAAEGPDAGLVALHFPDHPVSGEYRVLRDEVRAQLPDPTPRVLLFTAAAQEAGTTTVLLNLAITLAREETPRVLVVDANLPSAESGTAETGTGVGQKLAQPPGPGLAEVLAQQVPLAWAVRSSAVPNLQVLAAGAPTPGVAAVLGEDLPKLIDQLRQWYDWVLIDGGVWGTLPERDAICPAADAVYLVSRESDVDRSEFAGLRGWVKQLGGLLRGYITTRV
jgi:Mrp family chromosome partitioning ATPase